MKKLNNEYFVLLAAFVLFGCLNYLMVQYRFDLWTHMRAGFWSLFHKDFVFSGFDQTTYIVMSKWRPLFNLTRHPLLSLMCWPFAQTNGMLMDLTSRNCVIMIVAVLWLVMDVLTFRWLYIILYRHMSLRWHDALVLTLMFYGLAYVMLASFVPDHQVISLFLLTLTLYLISKHLHAKRPLERWKMWLLFFLSTGVTTTNSVKIVIADLLGSRYKTLKGLTRSYMGFGVVAFLLLLIGITQSVTTQRNEREWAERQTAQHIAKDSVFARQLAERTAVTEQRIDRQMFDNPLFDFTDPSLERGPALVENIFGEGFLLHEDYLMQDSNRERPVIVNYHHSWTYLAEALIVLLCILGAWLGRRNRLLHIVGAWFLFDMILHVGLTFALRDVYIMTAHWALVVPVSLAFLLRKGWQRWPARVAIMALTVYLYAHNLWLLVPYLMHN